MQFNRLLTLLFSDLRNPSNRGKLVRSAGAVAALRAGGTILAFGASLLYARILGPHDYGLYAYVIAWAAVLTIPSSLGLPQYLVREGAKTPEQLYPIRQWADRRLLLSGIGTAILLACAALIPRAAGARLLFLIAAPLPLLNAFGSVRQALLQACGQVARSQWPTLIAAPLIMLLTLLALWFWQGSFTPVDVITALTITSFIALFINDRQLKCVGYGHDARSLISVRLKAALPFMWLSGLYMLNSRIDILLLGAFKGALAAGIYAVAARAAELVTFFLMAANMVMAPQIARLYDTGDNLLLQRLLSAAARRVFLMSIPVALLFISAGDSLLGYLYGARYTTGYDALKILAAAQLVNVAAGPTATILNMTGHEKLSALGVGFSLALNAILNLVLIPVYGIIGAAIATAASLVVWNIIFWYWIRRRLHLRPTGIGL